jgi:hypothetical protein
MFDGIDLIKPRMSYPSRVLRRLGQVAFWLCRIAAIMMIALGVALWFFGTHGDPALCIPCFVIAVVLWFAAQAVGYILVE